MASQDYVNFGGNIPKHVAAASQIIPLYKFVYVACRPEDSPLKIGEGQSIFMGAGAPQAHELLLANERYGAMLDHTCCKAITRDKLVSQMGFPYYVT